MKFFTLIQEKSTPKVRKIVHFIAGAATTLFGFLLLFVPFIHLFYEQEITSLSPLSGLILLQDDIALAEGSAYIGLALFAIWAIYMTMAGFWLAKAALNLFGDETVAKKRARKLCILHSVGTAVYYISGIIFNLVNKAVGGYSQSAASAWPLICVLVLDGAYALYLGILKGDVKVKETETPDPRNKTLKKKRWETFLYASLLVGCAMLAFLTKIIDVRFVEGTLSNADYDFSMTGIDVLKNYQTLERGSQVLAFLLFLAISIVLTFYFLAIVALLSKSKAFFQFSMGSIIASAIGCFLIGMYGKYYEILQSLNLKVITAWVEFKIAEYGVGVDLSSLQTQFLQNCEISSPAFYFFLAAMAVAGLLLARRPYSKGLAIAKELEPDPTKLVANITNAEIDVKNLEEGGEHNPTPYVSSGNGGFADDTQAQNVDPCPAFTELDELAKETQTQVEARKAEFPFEEPTLPKLVQFIVQYARDSRLHLFYTAEDIATFIAGLGATKLTILQGMSGTGKTSLPKIFAEALYSNCNIVEVESSWRDKNELLGYYNEFSKTYTPKKFTQALYAASLNPETLTFIVLDEMNLSRIEYYFSDFLSLMESEPDKREIKLLNVGLFQAKQGQKVAYDGLTRGHTLKIPPNVWFIGTANRDESTFEISDKVYDRAHTMNFNRRAQKVKCYNDPLPQKFLPSSTFNALLEEAKKTVDFNVDNYPVIGEVEKLLAPYNISFGNRIAMQMEQFVSIYCACFTPTEEVIHDAVERILLTKVVSKLELKSIEDKEELAAAFEELGLPRCAEFISKLNED